MPLRSTLFAAFVLVAVSCQQSSSSSSPEVKTQKSALEVTESTDSKESKPGELAWPALPRTELEPLKLATRGEFIVPTAVDESVKRPATVKLPTMAGRPFEVRDAEVAVRVKLLGQQPVPAMVKDGVVLYSGGLKGAHVLMRPSTIGVEDFVTLDGNGEAFVDYEVELEGIAGLRLLGGQLEFLTDDGNPRLRMRPPLVITRQGESVPVDVSVRGCPVDTSPAAPWDRKVQPCTGGRVTVHLAWELAGERYPALLDPGWTTTGDLTDARGWAPTVTLGNGFVLTTGGFTGNGAGAYSMVSTSEIFNPVAGTWARTGVAAPMVYSAPAIWVPARGRAYVFGGSQAFIGVPQVADVRSYDPGTGTWAVEPAMATALELHSATLLLDGRVFIAGGVNGAGASATRLNYGHVYTPGTGVTTLFVNMDFTGGFQSGRCAHVAVRLFDGRVLLSHGLWGAGGTGGYNMTGVLFDPATNTASLVPGSVAQAREFAAGTLLSNGVVLITGGAVDVGGGNLAARNTTEFFGGAFVLGPNMATARYHHQQINHPDGRVIVAGGESPQNVSTNLTEIYTLSSNAWTNGGNLATARRETGIALTGQNYIIVAGGIQGSAPGGTVTATRSTEAFELLPNGSPCPGPGVCQSRFCVDGVCCNSACGAGTCDSCAVAGSVGTCSPSPASTVCRPAAGTGCDVAETCTGSSTTCPADGFATGTVCRPAAAGGCDVAETCPGGTPNCPADGFAPATTVCRSIASGSLCDVAENCTGTSATCPADGFRPASFTCRSATSVCDVAESCPGNSANCPTDGFAANTVVCRGDAGVCDVAERCTGSSATCPGDSFQPSTVRCRGDAGVCDVAEFCTGSAAACPANAFQPASVTCRGATSVCDVAESCTGSSAACPADGFAANTVVCRPDAGECDVAERCTGSSSTCPGDGFLPATVTCRGSTGVCDVAETCTGSGASCPMDGFQPNTVVCRGDAGICDVAELCTGSSSACPNDAVQPATVTCRGAADLCDAVETCDGTGVGCPADLLAPANTVCRGNQGTCDVVETCSGASITCGTDNFADAGTVCDTTYVCSGVDAGCPTTCTDSSDCAIGATCVNGVCVISLPPGSPCTSNANCASNFCVDGVCCNTACDEACAVCNQAGSVGTCAAEPAGAPGMPSCSPYLCDGSALVCPGSCANNSQCVSGFVCVAGRCVNTLPNGNECTADAQCASGFCTDGVCCNSRCDQGACQSCNTPGAVGTCSIHGRGDPGAPSCAPFVCDGTNPGCPTTCADDAECGPPAFCENERCVDRTRGHVGFSCGGCSSVDGASLLGLLAVASLLRRRRQGAQGGGR